MALPAKGLDDEADDAEDDRFLLLGLPVFLFAAEFLLLALRFFAMGV